MYLLKKLLLLFLLVLVTSVSYATFEPIVYTDSSKTISIGALVQVLEDTSNSLTADEVIYSTNFVATTNKVPNLDLSKSSFWVRIELKNTTPTEHLMLALELPIMDEVELYSPTADGGFSAIRMGEDRPFTERKYQDPNYLFDLYIKTGATKTYLMRVKGRESVQLPLSIGPPQNVLEYYKTIDIVSGFYFGIILVMLFYNLFIYFSVRDKSYLLYVLYILLVGLTQTSLQGYPFKYLWPNTPWIAQHSLFLFPSLVGAAGLQFMRVFLNAKHYIPKLNRYVPPVLFSVYVGCIILAITGKYTISYKAIEINAMCVSLFMLVGSIIIWRRGYRPAKFFFFAWVIFLAGVTIFVMKDLGVLPYNGFTRYTMHIGSGIEVVLLSFALADRINILTQEKEASQAEALRVSKENEQIIKQQNIVLESKVQERTVELQKSNEELNDTLNELKDTQSQLVNAEKMASLGQLTAGIAHEINNPINFVTANVQPLRRDIDDILTVLNKYAEINENTNLGEKLKEIADLKVELETDYLIEEINSLIDGIGEGASRTAEIVKGLKNFSRLDENDLKMANINEGLNSTITLLDNTIKDNNIKVVKAYDDIPVIECYAGKLNQLFMNLLNNGVQAINMREDKSEQGELVVTTLIESEDRIVVKIADNGIGMTDEVKHRIFEPFYTTKEVGEGTGLGLSIAYNIIESHNGTVKVESEVGKGTTFIIGLPISQQ